MTKIDPSYAAPSPCTFTARRQHSGHRGQAIRQAPAFLPQNLPLPLEATCRTCRTGPDPQRSGHYIKERRRPNKLRLRCRYCALTAFVARAALSASYCSGVVSVPIR